MARAWGGGQRTPTGVTCTGVGAAERFLTQGVVVQHCKGHRVGKLWKLKQKLMVSNCPSSGPSGHGGRGPYSLTAAKPARPSGWSDQDPAGWPAAPWRQTHRHLSMSSQASLERGYLGLCLSQSLCHAQANGPVRGALGQRPGSEACPDPLPCARLLPRSPPHAGRLGGEDVSVPRTGSLRGSNPAPNVRTRRKTLASSPRPRDPCPHC